MAHVLQAQRSVARLERRGGVAAPVDSPLLDGEWRLLLVFEDGVRSRDVFATQDDVTADAVEVSACSSAAAQRLRAHSKKADATGLTRTAPGAAAARAVRWRQQMLHRSTARAAARSASVRRRGTRER